MWLARTSSPWVQSASLSPRGFARISYLAATKPHIAALNMGSMNYAKWRAMSSSFAFKFVFQNSFDDIIAFAKAIKDCGAKPELECFDTGRVYSYRVLEDMGLLEKPYHFSFIMGVLGGIPASTRHMAFQAENVPPGSR